MKLIKTTVFILMFLTTGFVLYSHFFNVVEIKNEKEGNFLSATLGDAPILVEVADTKESRIRGLSGRESIGSDGLLIVFPDEGAHGIWMKNMNFGIDIVWIDSYGRVVFLKEGVLPETYPEVFEPRKNSKFVLEVEAGRAKKEGWKVGSLFVIKN